MNKSKRSFLITIFAKQVHENFMRTDFKNHTLHCNIVYMTVNVLAVKSRVDEGDIT